jgi:hypothetical protein
MPTGPQVIEVTVPGKTGKTANLASKESKGQKSGGSVASSFVPRLDEAAA